MRLRRTLFALFALVIAVSGLTYRIATSAKQTGTTSQTQGDVQQKSERFKIDRLTGDAVRLRARQLRSINKAMARAMKDAEK